MQDSISHPVTKRTTQTGWWWEPTLVAVAFGLFALYSLWEVFFQVHGRYHNYLSPYFSPELASWLRIPIFPALWVAWVPLLFRATCYYYRREYYRALFWSPPACAVPDARALYKGETRPPMVWTYFHRFFFYLAAVVVVFLWIDAVRGFNFEGHFGVGLGSLILLVDAAVLSLYTFSCHAFRHMVGGNLNCYACRSGKPRARYRLWRVVSRLNQNHGLYAWISMFWVWGTAVYVRLLILGLVHDPRLF
ncbi:MAG: hypothetical protein ACP5QO_06120 [Clostridia bacterium]